MSTEQAAVIRQTHLNARDPQGEQLESASRICPVITAVSQVALITEPW